MRPGSTTWSPTTPAHRTSIPADPTWSSKAELSGAFGPLVGIGEREHGAFVGERGSRHEQHSPFRCPFGDAVVALERNGHIVGAVVPKFGGALAPVEADEPVADLGSHGNGDRGLDDGHEVTADVDVVARIRRRAHGIGDEGAEEVLTHGTPFSGPPRWRRSCRHRSAQTASSSEPPTSVGVGVPSSRSLATATREAVFSLGGKPAHGLVASLLGSIGISACASGSPSASKVVLDAVQPETYSRARSAGRPLSQSASTAGSGRRPYQHRPPRRRRRRRSGTTSSLALVQVTAFIGQT